MTRSFSYVNYAQAGQKWLTPDNGMLNVPKLCTLKFVSPYKWNMVYQ